MAAEVRHIVFSPVEIAQAAAFFLSRTGRIASGQITGVEVSAAPEPRIDVAVTQDDGARETITIEQTEVLAAILLYCQDKRIPIARSATKLFGVAEGTIVLTLHIDVAPQHGDMYHRIFCVGYSALAARVRAAA